ncbi:AAA family ATPase [Flavobacterium sp. LM4]|uniref:AAA family ATPase n=1 Tax=Flavobacterium sp. LM4 TaxID=1938609 RepID=UPI000992F29A|nr:AAA family ATPase [Flavobacterium sp. LM4]OOV17326.1 hypothetical protein BXU10_14565 [Flavobacterium sp. LM4]
MQLIKLHIIDRYNDLSDFTISFSDKVSLFVGVNGSGKSSVLEAVARIFSWTNLIYIEGIKSASLKNQKDEITPDFSFEIEYYLRLEDKLFETSTSAEFYTDLPMIKITGDKGNSRSIKIFVFEGKDYITIEKSIIFNKNDKKYSKFLPENLIIYYSGVSESMHKLCEKHENLFSEKLRDFETPNLRALFYFTPNHFKYLLLALLCFEFGPLPIFFNETIKISSVQNIKIILAKPSWGKGNSSIFWGAIGRVKQFLDLLKTNSNKVTSNNKDTILEVEMSLDGLRNVREFFITETEMFRLFDIAHFDTLIQDIEITLVHKDTGNTFDYKSLSEGEQQLITITGLNEILIKANSLALMDEPDSYLHPSRQRELIPEILNRFNDFCQILVTTHSPFVAQSVDLNKIQIFEPNKNATTKVEDDLMSYPVIAEGIFGIKSEFSIEVENDIETFRKIRDKVLNDIEYSKTDLKDIVLKLQQKGDEITSIINREVNQLIKLKGNIFTDG